MKRADWDPEGARNPQNRGKSKFVRISWDEAAELVAKELKRVRKEYGPTAVLAQCDGHGETKVIHAPHGCQTHLLNLLGGYTHQARQADSWEGWFWGGKHVWGQDPVGQGLQTNLWKDISEHGQLLLFWGCDQETTPWGWGGQMASRLTYWFSELGIKQIYISPDLNYAAAVHADKWIPVKPNTDAAMQLAIAYVWIEENTYDQDYVATHVHGFEEFKQYVTGQEDGIPKTPVWASEICGVPSRVIKTLARKWAREATSIVHGNGGSYIRSAFATEPARLEICLLGMQGLGKPGRGQLKMIEWGLFGIDSQNPGPRPLIMPNLAAAYTGAPMYTQPQFIPKTLVPQAILSKDPITWYSDVLCVVPRENQFIPFQFPIEGGSRVHMIWSDSPCWTTCWNGGNSMIEAIRDEEIECVVVQHPCLAAGNGAVYKRPDGMVIIDPEKAQGNKQLMASCPYGVIYWNDALKFGEEEELKEWIAKAEVMEPESGLKPRVYYLNPPKNFVAGEVWDPQRDECLENAEVTLTDKKTDRTWQIKTDEFGDFWFRRLEAGRYALQVKKEGYYPFVVPELQVEESVNIGEIALQLKK